MTIERETRDAEAGKQQLDRNLKCKFLVRKTLKLHRLCKLGDKICRIFYRWCGWMVSAWQSFSRFYHYDRGDRLCHPYRRDQLSLGPQFVCPYAEIFLKRKGNEENTTLLLLHHTMFGATRSSPLHPIMHDIALIFGCSTIFFLPCPRRY